MFPPTRARLLASSGLAFILACGRAGGGGGAPPPPAPVLTTIAITPASSDLAQGASTALAATGTYSDSSTATITTAVTWSSAQPAIASVGSSTGLVTGLLSGSASITASLGGVTSPAATVTVTVSSGALVSIAVTGATPSLFPSPSVPVASTLQMKATGTYSDATTADVTSSVAWSSADPSVATVDPTTGLATGVAEGQSAITASAAGVTSPAATLTVHWNYAIRAVTLGGNYGYVNAVNAAGQVAGIESGVDPADPSANHAYLDTQGTTRDLGAIGIQTALPKSLLLNASGQVAGVIYPPSGPRRAFLYSGVSLQDLGSLGGSNSQVDGLNSNGYVVGSSEITPGSSTSHGYLYRDGPPMVDLGGPGPGFYPFVPRGINDLAQIVGSAMLADGSYNSHTFIYEGGLWLDLGTDGHASVNPVAINSLGHVAGSMDTHGFLFSGGLLLDVGMLGASPSFPSGVATPTALNDLDQVVGWSIDSSMNERAFLYDRGAMIDLGPVGIFTGNRNVLINNGGQVVGGLQDYGPRSRAFLYSKGLGWWLQDLVPGAAAAGWTELYQATGLNDAGLIIGRGRLNGKVTAFLLEPITH